MSLELHAVVLAGDITEYRQIDPVVLDDQSLLPPHKPRILPVVAEDDAYDPVREVLGERTTEVESDRVVWRRTARAKNEGEIAGMIAEKDEAIEAEFTRLYNLPIDYEVGGETYTFHADEQARENITGVLMAYREAVGLGLSLPDPRPWTPMGEGPISISRAQLAGLGIAIAARKDALFTIKKMKQAALSAMTDPTAIHAVDPAEGWE